MKAYDEIYLGDAMYNLGEMLDYAVNSLSYDIDKFFSMFSNSIVGNNFEKGNPKYVTGMSGIELAWAVLFEKTGKCDYIVTQRVIDKSVEYWTGWAIAYYQNNRNISFRRMIESGVTASRVSNMYILHEADITKFVETIDILISNNEKESENRLRRLRKYAELTQKELSEKAGVSLRMIQLYEQGQNDINKAQVNVVVALSKALRCEVTDLLE